ncbi:MAG: DUF748 domain-containing protein [Candidatus Omnitrophica bacterium]|nr:DUF748 domain-containing protein [Candidatus Omnitrophota bacterium]
MKKIILALLAFLSISAIAWSIYLNEIVLPKKIKAAIVESLSRSTDKNVSVASAKFSIFKGIVVKELAISEKDLDIFFAKEIRFHFLIPPLFKKQVIVTAMKIDHPKIFIERLKDNSVNIVEMFFKKPFLLKDEFSLTVSKIVISHADILFKDDTFDPPFTKDIKNMSLDARLSLPDKVIFSTEFEIPSKIPAFLDLSGEYRIQKKESSVSVKARDLYLKEFAPYFKNINMEIPDGSFDAHIKLNLKDNILDANIDMTSLGLIFSIDRIKADINCSIKAKSRYDFGKKELMYSGSLDIRNLILSNLDYVERIDDIRGTAVFSESEFSSKDIKCTILGVPVKAMAECADLQKRGLVINITSVVGLKTMKDILKTRFNISMPAEIEGEGNLNLKLQYLDPAAPPTAVNGHMDVEDASLILEFGKMPLKNVSGAFIFTSNQLFWKDLEFRYMDADCISSGILTNFDKPGIDLELDSDKMRFRSLLAINNNFITLSSLEGRYDNFEFSVYGDLDTADPSNIAADVSGLIKFNLDEDKEPFKIFKDVLKNSRPSGRMAAKFNLKGNLKDFNKCSVTAEVSSAAVSLYGFRMDNFKFDFMQRNGVMDIVRMQAFLYGGALNATGSLDLASKDSPYQINADIKGVRIEKIKKDTAFKDNDIAGFVNMHFGLKGFSGDLSRLNGWGNISVSEGKLWQLNLFKGLGALLFRKDFSSVIFKEGFCDFYIKDKTAFTNDLVLRSDLLNINGNLKIGFDNSIGASMKAEFTDEGVDAARISDMAGAIERYTIIEVNGTLKEPKYKIRPDLTNVVSDIAENLFRR